VRLDTLIRLRWLAVCGQLAAVLVVHFGLEFEVPIWACLAVIALAAVLNVALRVSFRQTQWLEPDRAAWLLTFDIAELAALLYLTGGLENPFAFLLLGPVLISATALPPRMTLLIGTFAMFCATMLVFLHYDLPWDSENPLELPEIYMVGVWLSILLAIGYIGVYTWQVAEEARQLSDALAATELVLAREQHLSQLDGLAAAAAHELGTPLTTISVVAKELARETPEGPLREDAWLLMDEAQRCRGILKRLTDEPERIDSVQKTTLRLFLEDIVAPYDGDPVVRVQARLTGPPQSSAPDIWRRTEIFHALSSIVENAFDFARSEILVTAKYDNKFVTLEVTDDGPGFASEILDRLGDPYVTTRPAAEDSRTGHIGMGLGFFIAKTLLERTEATVSFRNGRRRGAIVSARWHRNAIEAPS